MLKRVLEDASKKAILVLPYVALVQEKLKWLRKVVEHVQKTGSMNPELESEAPKWRQKHSSSVRIVGFFGGSKARANWRDDVDIAVCTIEKVSCCQAHHFTSNQSHKANGLVSKFLSSSLHFRIALRHLALSAM